MTQLIKDLTQINRLGHQYRTSRMAPLGLKACHAGYLMEIAAQPGISQDQLARRVCADKSNVARQIAALEEDGFVRRTPSESDKRAMRLYLTPRAEEALPAVRSCLLEWDEHLTSGLTDEEKQQLARILSAMKQRAAEWVEVE